MMLEFWQPLKVERAFCPLTVRPGGMPGPPISYATSTDAWRLGPKVLAAVMSALSYALVALGRRPEALAVCAASALISMLMEPHDALHPGFVLSVLATSALLTLSQAGSGWLGTLKESARTWVATAPFLCVSFGTLQVVSVAANVVLAPGESQDYDFMASWEQGGTRKFAPVQIKELVPAHSNAAATVEQLFTGLAKYVDSQELVVAIHINREFHFDPRAIGIPSLPIAELWAFGASSPDQNNWVLWGDLLQSGEGTAHVYPAVA